jgi:Flp pilus assembly protein TadD
VGKNPTEARYHSWLGLAYAYRGDKQAAIREGQRAVELMPETRDAVDGPIMETNLAHIYARVGEPERALDLIEHLLTVPSDDDVLHKRGTAIS